MAFWKQLAIALVLALIGLLGWGAFDPGARPRLIAAGVPAPVLPSWAFLAGDASASPDPADAQRPGGKGGRDGGIRQGGTRPDGQAGRDGGARGPTLVVTAPVVLTETADRVSAIGTAEAARTVVIYPRTTGMVTQIGFAAGERLATGATLIKLDDDSEQIALGQARIALDDAVTKAKRNDMLAATKAISTVDRDTAQSELAKARLALQAAELNLSRRIVVAPFDGVVGLTAIEVGDMVSAATEIATIDDRSAIKVAFRVPEAFAARVGEGQTVDVRTPSQPGAAFVGKVTAVGSRIEADSRTLVVQATVANDGDRLRPGMSFEVTVHFAGDTETSVPALAVQWDRDGSYVWMVDDGKTRRVGVAILERNSDIVLVQGDLQAGDQVVVEGIQQVRADGAVRVAAAGGSAP